MDSLTGFDWNDWPDALEYARNRSPFAGCSHHAKMARFLQWLWYQGKSVKLLHSGQRFH